jgi:sulfate/thiosulfate transport system permease protein
VVTRAVDAPGPAMRRRRVRANGTGTSLSLGVAVVYLSLIVLIPLAALAWKAVGGGWSQFWTAVTSPEAVAALRLTFEVTGAAVAINAVMGTLIAWVLVRDAFPGRAVVDVLLDLPFALPTIVAGLTLLSLYGVNGPLGVNIAYTKAGIVLALMFVTLPFSVRAVQPVLAALDRDMEDAAATLGAGPFAIARRVVLPNLAPAILSGIGLAFSRAIGEFGAVVLIAGNLPFKTETASVYIFGQIENDNAQGAAAASLVLLVASLVLLVIFGFLESRVTRHEG